MWRILSILLSLSALGILPFISPVSARASLLAQADPQVVSPTLFCMGACPTTKPDPSTPLSGNQPGGAGSSDSPCKKDSSISDNSKKSSKQKSKKTSKHKKHTGAVSGSIEELLNKLLSLLKQLMGGGGGNIDGPSSSDKPKSDEPKSDEPKSDEPKSEKPSPEPKADGKPSGEPSSAVTPCPPSSGESNSGGANPSTAPSSGAAPSGAAPSAAPSGTTNAQVPVGKKEVFVADFETGDTSQWGDCQTKSTNGNCGKGSGTSISLVPDAKQGKFAARFELHPGDTVAGGERTEFSSSKPGAGSKEGDEYWFSWSEKFDNTFTNPTADWFIILQWHSDSGSPPIAVEVRKTGDIEVTQDGSGGNPHKLGTVHKGVWTDYVLHIKFSRNASTGFIEGWENGVQTLPKYNRATLRDGDNYLKQGIYRGKGDSSVPVVYVDNLRITAP